MTHALGVTSNNFDNLFTLVLICSLGQLLPAPLLRLIPDSLNRPEAEDSSDSDSGGPGRHAEVQLADEGESNASVGNAQAGRMQTRRSRGTGEPHVLLLPEDSGHASKLN
jgi:hypothetical protein